MIFKSEKRRKLLSAVSSVVLSGLICLPASATNENQNLGDRGDLNADGSITSEDIKILTNHLTTASPLTDAYTAQLSDINCDYVLNGVDLALMQQAMCSDTQPETISPKEITEDALLESPAHAVSWSMPSTGIVRIPVFVISFPDCDHAVTLSSEEIRQRCFCAEDSENKYAPYESITGYFQRASYGRLCVDGDVYTYTAKNPIHYYSTQKDLLLDEMLEAFDDEIDYTQYDANSDGIIDTLIAAVPNQTEDAVWHAVNGVYSGSKTFDGLSVGRRCIGRCDVGSHSDFNRTWAHELCHSMGLQDYYKYANYDRTPYGMNGNAGWELMDDAFGDLSAFSKLMLGWYQESEIQIYEGGTQTFQLCSSQNAPALILIPHGETNDFLSEYCILEYVTAEGNNDISLKNGRPTALFSDGGLRVLHCDAELFDGQWGTEFKWCNYGKNYNSSNDRQRIIRLANEAEGGAFLHAGDVMDSQTSGFHWYDVSGRESLDIGVSVTVDDIADGICTVTISPN